MRKQNQYTEDQKAYALAALKACGGNYTQAAEKACVPYSTLRHWAQGEGINETVAKTEHEKKADLADLFESVARECLDILPEKLPGAKAAEIGTVLGIATDKMRLLREQPTGITEQRAMTRAEKVEKARQLAERHGLKLVG